MKKAEAAEEDRKHAEAKGKRSTAEVPKVGVYLPKRPAEEEIGSRWSGSSTSVGGTQPMQKKSKPAKAGGFGNFSSW